MARVPVSTWRFPLSAVASGYRSARAFLSVFAVALVGLALSITAWSRVAYWEDRQADQEFTKLASGYAQSLQNGVGEYINKLIALRAFFDAKNDSVARKEFDDFVREILSRQNVIQGFAWVPRVLRDERASHEEAGAREGIPDYRIRTIGTFEPAPEADEYFPIFYSNEPLTANIYGLNVHDGDMRQHSIEAARDRNGPATTRSFHLQIGKSDLTGFFVALPVYRRGAPRETLEERRRNLIGFVQGAFVFNFMVDSILTDVTSRLNVVLYDSAAGPDDIPVHVASAHPEEYLHLTKSRAESAPGNWLGELSTADKQWLLMVTPAVRPSTLARHSRAWIVLCAGLLISTSLVAYMWNSIHQFRRLQAASNAVLQLARTDALTGLANRRAFVERLTESFASVARGNAPFAVHFIDLDGFKDINDTQGHAVGDALLVAVAARLTSVMRANDVVARFGGDEFAVLQSDVGEADAAAALAGKVIRTLDAPYAVAGLNLHITASVGVALHSECLDGPKDIMMQADLALYSAKDDGRDRYRFHSGELDQQVKLRVMLADELRHAVEREEIELHFQPQVEIASGLIVGLEALARWNHPTRGLILPSIFVPIAERNGGIAVLGQWVLARACRQLKEWQDRGIAVPRLAINVSGAQLKAPRDFELAVAQCFMKWGIRRNAIELEITETIMVDVNQRHAETLERLQCLGAAIAIDDFGTGYSSLQYLTSGPIHRLKIAQELIAGISTDSRSAVVVRSAIRLGHELGIEVVAEGVETAEQARFLLDAGCAYAQGNFYARPADAGETARLLVHAAALPLPEKGRWSASSAA
jgi:diguanylate cyclase (GGDEF)-like protein